MKWLAKLLVFMGLLWTIQSVPDTLVDIGWLTLQTDDNLDGPLWAQIIAVIPLAFTAGWAADHIIEKAWGRFND